ncbi:hypothetical protein FHQ08_09025 [Lactobacillus sp. CC-MHH1034]|uniref:glycerophosphodiester phosphodiesterase family protein n=1 Tax=Agrilactobacillus fermenti TaxID=2586909 RepID=UPI001E524B2A|nr:glycerophosphodiester phosphodiesterase family protein [Agrilactobacillus fermenti]MCD2256863.1 hypothetical protein [Agrilactobacillus fermenti]
MSAWVFKHYARLAYHYLIKCVLQALVSQLLLLLFSAILLIFIPTPTWSYIFMRIGQIAVGVILIQQLRQNQPIWSLKVRSGIVSISALILLFINVLPILTIPQAHMVSQWQWIAHRGVNGNDGVQNSIGALRQTHLKYPSYIELDLRLTKDQKFVVMHDPNTYHLTGKREDIAQHTQEQLRRLVLTEYQKHAHIASFDTYLSVANRLHQPLMVELKTVPGDPAAHIAQLFTSRYQRRLAQNHAIVHASNLRLLQALKHQHFKLPVGYIVPFSFWQTSGGQYDYESSNGRSYCAALPLVGTISKKQHYLWTENDPHSFILYDIGIQGLITDQLSLIQSEFKKQNNIFSKITVNMFLLFRLFC